MAIKVWIGENLDRRHEQEQMKQFLSLMHTFYDNQPSTVHVLCNFICSGSQIDAAVLKTDAFVPIEFKTADGPVSGSENGKWKFKDPDTYRVIELGGGSHASNPYNQIANARTAVAQKLENNENVFFRPHECERVADWRHFVHGLVVLAPNLDEEAVDQIDVDFYAKPWFDCCRIKNVAEVVSKTTTRDGELSNKNILKIISQVLHLEEAEMRDGVPVLRGVVELEDQPSPETTQSTSSREFGQTFGDVLFGLNKPPEKNPVPKKPLTRDQMVASFKHLSGFRPVVRANPTQKVSTLPPPKQTPTVVPSRATKIDDPQVKTAFEDIKGFVCEDLPEFVESTAIVCARGNASALPVPIEGDWDYVIELKCKGDANRALAAVNEYWTCPYTRPYVADNVIVWKFPEANNEVKIQSEVKSTPLQSMGFLPPIIEDFIAEHPNARYSPDALTASSNLSADAQRAEWYLGTYFPRSFCEAFAIFDYIFANRRSELKISDKITNLDLGIGSGGAAYGLVWALRKWFKDLIKEITIVGYDGNSHALALCGDLACALTSKWNVALNLNTSNVRTSQDTLDVVENQSFDFILSSKAIQEMCGKFGYNEFWALANDVLKSNGVAMLLEIFSESRQAQIKTVIGALGPNLRLLLSSIEKPEGSTFGVISNLTTQTMEESISFAVWGGKDFSLIENAEIDVVCRMPKKKVAKSSQPILSI